MSEPRRRAVLGGALVLAGAAIAGCGSSPTTSAAALIDTTAGLVQPGAVHVGAGEPVEQSRQLVRTAQLLYTFWNTGDPRYLDRAVAPDFRDNTLPTGRPQGPSGPVAASKEFRAAVPDLTCELAELYVVGDTFTARLVFRGHFTGTYDGVPGRGQRVEFGAIDIQRAGGGSTITEDWHLEDNLTFLQQAGLVTVARR